MRSSHLFHKIKFLIIILSSSFAAITNANDSNTLSIGFGSCANQNREQEIWNVIASHQPDLFIMMGDNVYIDSTDPLDMVNAYKKLSANPNFSKFREKTPLIATWDDHDLGVSNGGKDFISKASAKQQFIKFFNYPEVNQTAGKDRGLYHTKWLSLNGKTIQIIMLDSRWYRDPVVLSYLTGEQLVKLNLGPLQPSLDTATTILGQQQWQWLEQELQKPADLKLLVSSIPVLAEFSGYEAWANFPHERTKLLDLLQKYGNNKVLILSGEIHKAEISALTYKNQETRFLDITSSGLAEQTYPASNNIHKLGKTVETLNYGMLKITDDGTLKVRASIYDDKGVEKLTADFKD